MGKDLKKIGKGILSLSIILTIFYVLFMDNKNMLLNILAPYLPFCYLLLALLGAYFLFSPSHNRKVQTKKREEKKMENQETVIDSAPPSEMMVENEPKEENLEEISEEISTWEYPPISLLQKSNPPETVPIKDSILYLESTLLGYGISGRVVRVNTGPTIIQYEIEVKRGTKLDALQEYQNDFSKLLDWICIQVPIPGKNTVGIELPNPNPTIVPFYSIFLAMNDYDRDLQKKLLIGLGQNFEGYYLKELSELNNLLVCGATGSGKSICINSILASILMRTRPEEVNLILIDPKKIELSIYNGVPHLITPVVTSPEKAKAVLQKIVQEMEKRYDTFWHSGVKNIESYNNYLEKENEFKLDKEKIKPMPNIVVIIEEAFDIISAYSEEVEASLTQILQMGRTVGIYPIVVTQQPIKKVMSPKLKDLFSTKICFDLTNENESREILGISGGEKLFGKGDMLFLSREEKEPIRMQGTFISDQEITAIVNFVSSQRKPKYNFKYEVPRKKTSGIEEDPLYDEIVGFVVEQGKASTSLLQRRFRLGYNMAARYIDLLEERGIVGPASGSKPREVLVKYGDDKNSEEE